MKKVNTVSAVMYFFACSFLLIAQPVSASTAWTTTDNDSTLYNINTMFHFDTTGNPMPVFPLTGNIGIFDLSRDVTSANSLELLKGSTALKSFQTYQDVSREWFAAETDSPGGAMTLSLSSNQFGFYYGPDDATGYLIDDTAISPLGENNIGLTWAVPCGKNAPPYLAMLAKDVTNQVSVPTALLLLGSGFAGILGFKRRVESRR